ncbi:MAG: hypothetical protein NTAFB05_23120 [Nitrobacter sp.]
MKGDRNVAEPDLFAIANSLRGTRKIIAVTQPHDIERFLRREHRAVTGAGMIGMTVSDDRAIHGTHRIDMEAARPAI